MNSGLFTRQRRGERKTEDSMSKFGVESKLEHAFKNGTFGKPDTVLGGTAN